MVYVYDNNPKIALDTLKHEYLDQAVTREVIKPLVDLVNLQTSLIVKRIYKRKEELIDRFSKGI